MRGLKHLPQGKQAEKAGAVQPGKERVLWRPHRNPPVPEGTYQEAGGGLVIRKCSDRTKGNW